jgi:acetyl-CoA C-acetyltransferase
VAAEYGVTREEQDEFAYASHVKYGKALERGFFKHEIEPLELVTTDKKGDVVSRKVLDFDEQYRPDISLEALAKMKPIYGNPTCTAGNAPGMNDGATAQIFTRREKAEALGLDIIYTVVTMATVALAPRFIDLAPGCAIKKCLDTAKLSIDDMKFIEINEAFACVPLVSLKLLTNDRFLSGDLGELITEASQQPILGNDEAEYSEYKNKVNVNGSAVATGHPNTATGARLMMTAAYNLREQGGGYAACGICGGLAQGAGCIISVE